MYRISWLAFLLLLVGSGAPAQSLPFETYLENIKPSNFHELQQQLNSYYDAHPGAPGYKQWKRREWFLEPRLYPSGESVNITGRLHDAMKQVEKQTANRSTHGNWIFLGPTYWTPGAEDDAGMGRLNCIRIHPDDENIIYVGSSSGGIWKTTNGGTSWVNISPYIPLLSIADIGLDPDNPNIVYALTGDGDPSPGEPAQHGQAEVSSIGIIKSTNGGSTWYPTNFNFTRPSGVVPIKLLIHPTDGDVQFMVGNDGIYRTDNAWATDTLVFTSETYDIEFHPANPLIMYASGPKWIRKSVNMGISWTIVTDSDFSILNNASRVELAVSPEDPSGVYALAGNWSQGLVGFYRSLTAGSDNTWTLRDSSSTNSMGVYAEYCIALAASPTDFSDVFGGFQWICRSFTEGLAGTWTSIVQDFVHADLHDIVVTSSALYVACDGGLYKSTDNGNTWSDLSAGLTITEIYRVAGTPQDPGLFYCGVQDNGTLKRDNSATFEAANGSDGTTCRINYSNSDTVYVGQQKGTFKRSIDGGASFQTLTIPGGGSEWITPFIMDPLIPKVIFVGKDSLFRSDNGGNTFTYLGEPTGLNLNCLAQGTSNRNRLYASTNSALYRTDNALTNSGTATYTNIGAGVPNLFITGIVVDPDNSSRVFVSLSGFSDGMKVYFSFDAGASWTNISGNLPNVPVNCIAFDNSAPVSDALYIGTDIGVFYRDLNLGDWIYYSSFLPAVVVNDLYIDETAGKITAGTYGRGMWQSDLYSGCPVNIVYASGAPLGGVRYLSATNQITSTAEFRKDLGTEVHFTAGQRIILNPGFLVGARAYFEGRIADCPGIVMPPFSSIPQHPQGVWEESIKQYKGQK